YINFDHPTLLNVLGSWHDSNPHSLLSFWANGNGAIKTNRVQLEAETNPARMTPDLQWTGTYNDWVATRRNGGWDTSPSLFKQWWSLFRDIPDIFYTNDLYQSRPDNFGWIHEAMMMTVMNRKFYPDKKMVWMDRHILE